MTDTPRTFETYGEIADKVNETLRMLGAESLSLIIEFNDRFTARMGDANWVRRRVRFSAPLWRRATVEEREQVIVHEVCHIVANIVAGTSVGHGPRWKAAMRQCGRRPDRCHNVDRTGIRRRNAGSVNVVCNCPGRVLVVGKTRAARMRLGIAKYTCKACKAVVRFQ